MSETKKYNILVVEDDDENQRFLRFFMSRYFNVETCDSETSFYEKIAKTNFDIILMDISLKGKKDGLQLLKEIRHDNQRKDIPVIVLSAHAFQRDKENAFKAGADDFLAKPVMNNVLLETIKKVLKEKAGKEI
jgi:CheY-like chemotaxis protein